MSSRLTEQGMEETEARLPVYQNGEIVTHVTVDEADYRWAQHLTFVMDDDGDVRIGIADGPRLCAVVLTNGSADIGRLGADSMDCVLRQQMQDAGYAVTADASHIQATDQHTGETFVVRYADSFHEALIVLAERVRSDPVLEEVIADAKARLHPGD